MSENKNNRNFLFERIIGFAVVGMLGCLSGYFFINLLREIFSTEYTMEKLREAPLENYLTMVGLLVAFGSLTYFLFLISYRAFSGRGRKKDGRLLPPLTVKIFAALWALILGFSVIVNFSGGNLWKTFLALLALGFCIKVLL